MRNKRPRGFPLRVVPAGSTYLHKIADALGVPVEALSAPSEPHVLHEEADGTRWLLMRGAQDSPVVRRMGGRAADDGPGDASVLDVLTRDRGSPQSLALAALIEHLLMVHLAD